MKKLIAVFLLPILFPFSVFAQANPLQILSVQTTGTYGCTTLGLGPVPCFVPFTGTSNSTSALSLALTGTTSTAPTNGAYLPAANELDMTTSGVVWVDATPKIVAFKGALSTVTSGSGDCGTSPVIAGDDTAGRITVGSSTNGGVCTLVFAATKTTAPICVCNDETGANGCNALLTSTTSTALTATTSYPAATKLGYHCFGYQQ